MINRQNKYLIISNLSFYGTFGLLFPIFPIFLREKIPGMNIQNIATTIAIFLFFKALFTWIFTQYLYQKNTKKRALLKNILGSILFTIATWLYTQASNIESIFFIQIIFSISFALTIPSWNYLIETSVKKQYILSFYKLHATSLTLILASMSIIGGFIAYNFNFQTLFYTMTILSFGISIINTIFYWQQK